MPRILLPLWHSGFFPYIAESSKGTDRVLHLGPRVRVWMRQRRATCWPTVHTIERARNKHDSFVPLRFGGCILPQHNLGSHTDAVVVNDTKYWFRWLHDHFCQSRNMRHVYSLICTKVHLQNGFRRNESLSFLSVLSILIPRTHSHLPKFLFPRHLT